MSAEYRIPSWAIVTIATLLFTACNPHYCGTRHGNQCSDATPYP